MPNITINEATIDDILLTDNDSNITTLKGHTNITEDYTIMLPPAKPSSVNDILQVESLTDELESGCGVSNTLTGASIHAWGDDD